MSTFDPLQQRRMVELLDRLAPSEGYTLSAIDGVRFMRSNRSLERTPVMYEPSIVIVCQGRKRGFLGNEVHVYDAQHYLVLSVPLPFFTETDATVDEPMLAIQVRFELATLADLMLAVDHSVGPTPVAPKGMVSTLIEAPLADAVLRLLLALTSPLEAQVLGVGLVREVCFRVLMGEQGGAMRAALTSQGHFGKVAKALRRIHEDFARALDVGELASESGMSVPAFHAHFKAVTQTSPIQYLKTTRLHQARLMMIRSSATAASASAQVGYESASQFSREFKRFFGRSPRDEVEHMKSSLALLPAETSPRYVTAH